MTDAMMLQGAPQKRTDCRAPFAGSRGALCLLSVACLFFSLNAFAATIADFTADYLAGTASGQSRAARSPDGWDYMSNNLGPIGTSTNYSSLPWNTSLNWYSADGTSTGGYIASGSGRPAISNSQGAASDRFVIAAYTIQAGEAGHVYITNSTLAVTSVFGDLDLRIYVNNSQNGTTLAVAGSTPSVSFDRYLGNLVVGDKVFVALGPRASNTYDAFTMQFRLQTASAPPVFTPPPSTVAAASVQVTLSCATPDAAMYYTTNQSTPTAASTPYAGPFSASTTGMVKAIAISPTLGSSSVVTAVYSNGNAPPNDNFANATALAGSVPFGIVDDNIGATSETGEPHHAGTSAVKSVWYTWTPAATSTVLLTTAGSSLDTTLAVYTGTSLATLSLVGANADITTSVDTASQVCFVAQAGTKYAIAVDGNGGAEGSFVLNFTQGVQLSVIANVPNANETGPVNGSFQISRTGSTTAALKITYSVSGTAEATVDYLRLSETATFNAGSATVPIVVVPIDNSRYVAGATVVLTLDPPIPASADQTTLKISTPSVYAIDPLNASATVTITDNDPVATEKAGGVQFSAPHGFYDTPISLTLTSATVGAQIRYTLDGTVPTAASPLHSAPLNISSTTIIRAVAFASGFNPSKCNTSTYVFVNDVIGQSPTGAPPPGWPSSWGQQGASVNKVDYGMDPDIVTSASYSSTIKSDLKSIPVVSVVMKLDDLFNTSTNAYVGGIYANSQQEAVTWEKPCSIELFDPANAAAGFQANCGIRIRGGASALGLNPKHSFRLYFRDEYGAKRLDYPLFGPDPAAKSFQQFDLVAFSQDSWSSFQGNSFGSYIRDLFCHDTHLAMGQVTPRNNYYHLYLNGQYWGLYYTDEHCDGVFASSYFGGDADDYDIIKAKSTISYATGGTTDAWVNLWKQCKAGLSTNAAYYMLQGRNPDGSLNSAYENLLDVDALIDFMLVHYYIGNVDGPISSVLGNPRVPGCNNFVGARSRKGSAGFRFFVHDAELGTALYSSLNENRLTTFLPIGSAADAKTGDNVINSNPQWMFQQLAANAEFRQKVADKLQKYFFNGGVLTDTACAARFNARKNQIDRAIVAESARWGDSTVATPYTRDSTWLTEIGYLTGTYFPQRSGIVLSQFVAAGYFPSLSAPTFSQNGGPVSNNFVLTVTNPNNPTGTIYYTTDGSDPRKIGGTIQGTAGGNAVNIPINATTTVRARVLNGAIWSPIQEATFTTAQDYTKLKITEIMYNPPAQGVVDGEEFEFLELKNTGAVSLNLSNAQFTQGITYTFPLGASIGVGQFIVLCSNASAFASKYPGVTPFGTYSGHLANSGETLTLLSSTGATILTFSYNDVPPWPSTPDGLGFSLVPVNTASPGNPGNYQTWRPSAFSGGSPGADDPVPSSNSRVLINEALTHSDLPLVDYIELFNPGASPVDISGWFLTDDRNDPKKFKIPNIPQLGAGMYVVFTENDFNPTPGIGTSFSLSSIGEGVYLFAADAGGNLTGFSHGFEFGASATDVSFGRYTISTGDEHFVAQVARTSGMQNSAVRVGPVVLSEIMYHPAAGGDAFVELWNITAAPVQLFDPNIPAHTWRLNGLDFSFPQNTVLPANGLAVVCAINPVTFRQKYSVPPAVPVFGPYTGLIQLDGETLSLERPDTPQVVGTDTVIPYIVVDAVKYSNTLPWPLEADGNGPSLRRVDKNAYGNDPINWTFSSANGGSPGVIEAIAPPAPSNPAAAAISPSQIVVSWTDGSNNETGFKVERSLDGLTGWQEFATPGTNITSCQDSGRAPATLYYYRVRATNPFGDSDYTSVASAKTFELPPGAPDTLAVTLTLFNRVDLSWADHSTNEVGFKIERSPNGTTGWTPAGTVGANVTAFQDQTVAAEQTYFYRVFAYHDTDVSPISNVVSAITPPVTPNSLMVTATAFNHVDLSWVDASSAETGFKIERSPDGINGWTEVGGTLANIAVFSDMSVSTLSPYFYRVFAYNSNSVSAFSNVVNTTTPDSPPGPPTGLNVTLTAFNHVDLAWTDGANNESGFKIERSPNGVSGWVQVGTSLANVASFSDTSVATEVKYYYRVFAFNTSFASAFSNVVSTTTPAGPPAAPTSLAVVHAAFDHVELMWFDASSTEDGFKIERSPDGTNGWVEVGTAVPDATTFSDFTVAAASTYYYRVYALNAVGPSGFSNVVSTTTPQAPPAAPTGLTVTLAAFNRVALAWTDASGNEDGFKIERSPNGSTGWSLIGNALANAKTFQDVTVSPNTTYYYRVYAYIGASVSLYSNLASATTPPAPPAAPKQLTATALSDKEIALAWVDGSDSETGFRIERSPDGVNGWAQIGETAANATSLKDSGLAAVTFYHYRVCAFNASGSSAFSNSASAITLSPAAIDTDGDGISDAEEIAMGTNPLDAKSKPGGTADFDHDGIPDHLDTDADGDGVTNAAELAAGTKPYDAASFPFTAIQIAKLQCKGSFKSAGKDSSTLAATIPDLPKGFSASGKTLAVDIGGAVATFTLDAKGKAKGALGTAALALKFKRNKQTGVSEFLGGPVVCTVKLKGALVNNWLDEGFSATPSKTKTPATMRAVLRLDGGIYLKDVPGILSNNAFVSNK